MQEARELRDKGELKGALERFKAADGIMRVPTTAFEVARTQLALGLLIEARDTIAAIRKMPSKPTDPQPFVDARNKAEDLDASLAQRVPAVTVIVDGVAPGAAAITVDSEQVPAAAVGLPRKLNPGHHVVSARTADGEGSQEFDVAEKEQKEIHLTLTASPTAGAHAEGSGATGGNGASEAESSSARSHAPTLFTWVGIGVGGAGLITGGISGILSISKTSTLSKECPGHQCATTAAQKDFNTAQSMATVSNVGFIVGGVGAAVAVGSLVIGRPIPGSAAPPSQPPEGAGRTSRTPGLRVAPWFGFTEAGLRGSF